MALFDCYVCFFKYESEMSMQRQIGTVKWFNDTKGYGFIEPADANGDVFVHASALARSGLTGLEEGQKVSYELQHDPRKGKSSAENIALA